ncbi:MAG: SCO family protein [Gallionellaceae bacterium]|nr:SCO family protein [Gallionellaceae bacterium]
MRKLFLLFIVVLLAACAKPAPLPPTHAIDVSWRYDQVAPNFHLTDFTGKPRQLSDFRGKVVVLFFGFTHCPEICPTTMSDLSRALKQLGADADKVQVLFITIDPERDTADVLAKYVPYFNPAFIGLRGDAQATADAAKVFAVSYEKHEEKNGGYTMDHTDSQYLVGKDGRTVLMSPYGQRTDWLVGDLRVLLNQ